MEKRSGKRILFVMPVASQPRFIKRIKEYHARGYKITVASFERDHFPLNVLPSYVEYHSLGFIEHRNYVKRLPAFRSAFRKIKSLLPNADILYSFAGDFLMMIIPFLPRDLTVYYEMGDIVSVHDKWSKPVFDAIFRNMFHKVDRVVLTSPGFTKYLVEKYKFPADKVDIIENKMLLEEFEPLKEYPFRRLEGDDFTVGIMGLFRFRNMLDFLEAHKRAGARFKVKFFGGGPNLDRILDYADGDTVSYEGQFKYPDDLESMYDKVDLSFVMYDSDKLNVRLALPNKLYETIYFKRPILVSTRTYLSEIVANYGVGFAWDQEDYDGLIRYLQSAQFKEDYNSMEESFGKLDRETMFY